MKTQHSLDGISPIRVVRFQSIHEIDEEVWDTIASGQDLFHTHRFIRSVEDSKVESSRFWYLLFYQNDTPIGSAALSSFTVSLDLLTDKRLQEAVRAVRRLNPNFMKVEILFCGLPVSIGKNTIAISDVSLRQQVLDQLVREMTRIGREEKTRILCIKEFLCEETDLIDPVTRHQFFQSNSLPYMRMEIRWKDFESYLAELRHPYRRPILRSSRKFGETRPVIRRSIRLTDTKGPVLTLAEHTECSPRQFYELYLNVMDRAEIKLETLNQDFFKNIYTNLKNEMEILAVIKNGKVLAAALLTVYKATMTFMLAGIDYKERDEYEVYLNLLHGIVTLAIEQGCVSLELGQTPYWVKQRLGAKPIASYFYMREEHWPLNCLLKILRPFLFPKTKLQQPHVFRKGFEQSS